MVLGRTFLCFSFRCLSFGSFLYSVFKVPSPSSSDGFADRSASGDGEIRTLDPLLARQVLSQLSYAPIVLLGTFLLFYKSGSHLLSHIVSNIVPSAAQVLTIVFGMGTGVSPERIATGNICVAMSKN